MNRSKRWTSTAALSLSFLIVVLRSGDLHAAQDRAAAPVASPAQIAQATQDGAKTCLQCHTDKVTAAILRTPHAQKADERTPFAKQECESCHGAGAEHAASGGSAAMGIRFGRDSGTPVSEQNEVCLGCHQNSKRMNWHMSTHQANDLTCGACHSVHAVRDRMLVKAKQTEVCITCHRDQRAGLFKRSRHPLREGILACSGCHNSHGAFNSVALSKPSVNETCYSCHQEKRGPFLWEHQPVSERCTICHNPHGSNQPSMLKARGPQLCQTCHTAGFHPSTLYDGSDVAAANSRIIANNCINCHPRIHGSNHPSGPRLTR